MLTTLAAGRVYNFSHVVGRNAIMGSGFQLPIALAIGQDGVVYVVSRGNQSYPGARVTKVTTGGVGDEEFICEFCNHGEGDAQSLGPTSVALDRDGNVFVSDEWLQRISIFDEAGNFLGKWGTPGPRKGELNRPSGMAFDQEDNIYIVDSHNNRIQKFTRDGAFLAKFGEEGSVEGQFNLPWGITLDSQENIYVSDWGNHRVQKFSPEGAFLAGFGTFGSGVEELNYPTDVAVDSDGDLYVCDWANNRVQIFAPDGEIITSLMGDAQILSKWAQWSVDANPDTLKARRRVRSRELEWRFYYPTAVAFDEAKSRIMIVDCQRDRLQIYIKDKGYVDPQFNL